MNRRRCGNVFCSHSSRSPVPVCKVKIRAIQAGVGVGTESDWLSRQTGVCRLVHTASRDVGDFNLRTARQMACAKRSRAVLTVDQLPRTTPTFVSLSIPFISAPSARRVLAGIEKTAAQMSAPPVGSSWAETNAASAALKYAAATLARWFSSPYRARCSAARRRR